MCHQSPCSIFHGTLCSPNVCRFLDYMGIAEILLKRTLPLDGCDVSRGRIDRNLDADPVNLVATWEHTLDCTGIAEIVKEENPNCAGIVKS